MKHIPYISNLLTFASCWLFVFACTSQEAGSEQTLDQAAVYAQWHTLTLPFVGPETSEKAADNPFLNYRLTVEFQHQDQRYTVPGFYATDGNSAETSADSGNIWFVRFTPDRVGKWTYTAVLHHGQDIALDDDSSQGTAIALENASGEFEVIPSDKSGDDFRAHGLLEAYNGFFRFTNSQKYWLKGGTDSPENLLAYIDFDNTYRISASEGDGESNTTERIHHYAPHLNDWMPGDPTWQEDKGKALIGALNYLSSKGMNSVYFLTMNILGDGKDVWPYLSPEDHTRFDVSKLAQWEIVFQHMQTKGLLLHVVLQETENELMLDNGDTGPLRQLYLRELIARFAHHPGLIWNLGEENGPASFSPNGQDDRQRKAMASYIKKNDPYNHPVLLHTHSHDPPRTDILTPILGYKDLDGLSLQVDKREGAPEVVQLWKDKARASGHEWLIGMDEIGMWHTGAQPDSLDPYHDSLRRYVLWGTLMSGAAGVEWYFGAKNLHNDLTSEDWRRRDQLWELTNHAVTFFEEHLPYWQMQPEHQLINSPDAYCLHKSDTIYAAYLPEAHEYTIDLSAAQGDFQVFWYNPLTGQQLQTGTVTDLTGGAVRKLGSPPETNRSTTKQDWVVLIRKG